MKHGAPLSRRRFLRVAATTAALAAGAGGLWRLFGEAEHARPRGSFHRWRGLAFGAEVSIDLWAEDAAAAQSALDAARAEMLRLEALFSLYDGNSALSRLNRSGVLHSPPQELVAALTLAQRVAAASGGSFDPTVLPLWEALSTQRQWPPPGLPSLLQLVDYRCLEVGADSIRFLRPGMRATLNGVAQGWISEAVARLLRERGFAHALVDLGEKRATGPHPEGRPWRIGIESPSAAAPGAGVVELPVGALAVSGGYRDVFVPGKLHHLIDAHTGTSRWDWALVAVRAADAGWADALSTALAVSPAERHAPILALAPGAQAWGVRGNPGAPLEPLV